MSPNRASTHLQTKSGRISETKWPEYPKRQNTPKLNNYMPWQGEKALTEFLTLECQQNVGNKKW